MISQLSLAKQFLRNHLGEAFTPDEVKEILGLSVTGATLGRKFRAAVVTGELKNPGKQTLDGRTVSAYTYNPDFMDKDIQTLGNALFGGVE